MVSSSIPTLENGLISNDLSSMKSTPPLISLELVLLLEVSSLLALAVA